MKKNYTRPAVYTQRVDMERPLAAGSVEVGQIDEGYARRNDSWDDESSKQASSLSIKDVWE